MSAELHELGTTNQPDSIEVFHHTDLESALLITQVGFQFLDQVPHQVSRTLPFGPGCYFYACEDVALTEAMVNHMLDGVVIVARLPLVGLRRHAVTQEDFKTLSPSRFSQLADAKEADVIDLRGIEQGRGIVVVRPRALSSLKITGVRKVPSYGRAQDEAGAVTGTDSHQEISSTFVDDLLTRLRHAA